jgi:hypothetical protein
VLGCKDFDYSGSSDSVNHTRPWRPGVELPHAGEGLHMDIASLDEEVSYST